MATESVHGFQVTKGLHTKGSCVVVKHGEMELWLEAGTAAALGLAITTCAKSLIREDRAIRRKVRRHRG